MNEVKELPIGTEVKLPFGKIVVEEAPNCEGCLFELPDDCAEAGISLFGVCTASFRSDKKDVIFKAYEEGEVVWQ